MCVTALLFHFKLHYVQHVFFIIQYNHKNSKYFINTLETHLKLVVYLIE